MYDLHRIDLGKDEAEQDKRLQEYFLKTHHYNNAYKGTKTIVIGRKGSGKSAIFTLMQKELSDSNVLVIPITPDQYSWGALKDYQEKGILAEQAHTNAWKLTLLSAIAWKLTEAYQIAKDSDVAKYYQYMKDTFVPGRDNWFLNIVDKVKGFLSGIKTKWVTLDWGDASAVATPLSVIDKIKTSLLAEWPQGITVRILLDRLDDSWDASKESEHIIIGLLKAANEINAVFSDKVIITIFLRSDIYDNLFFDDQDKLRQNEEVLYWNIEELKTIVCERVRTSLSLPADIRNNDIWKNLFSKKAYRSRASAEKYVIDRTFKRPRDIISFMRFIIEVAVRSEHKTIEPTDTRLAEEEKYSQSKYKDLIIEYQKQFPSIKNLLDSLSGSLHKMTHSELVKRLDNFVQQNNLQLTSTQVLRLLFTWGVMGVKRQGRAGVRQRGGAHFYFYYDDPSINPLAYHDYYIHQSLRYYLNISEKRERIKNR